METAQGLNPSLRRSACLTLCVLVLCAPAAHAAADPARGQQLYETRCIACHSIEHNKVGPHHLGLMGRKAGGVRDYSYSAALSVANFRWDATSLDRWLANPEQLVPGQKMGYSVEKAEDRRDLIAYLFAASTSAGKK